MRSASVPVAFARGERRRPQRRLGPEWGRVASCAAGEWVAGSPRPRRRAPPAMKPLGERAARALREEVGRAVRRVREPEGAPAVRRALVVYCLQAKHSTAALPRRRRVAHVGRRAPHARRRRGAAAAGHEAAAGALDAGARAGALRRLRGGGGRQCRAPRARSRLRPPRSSLARAAVRRVQAVVDCERPSHAVAARREAPGSCASHGRPRAASRRATPAQGRPASPPPSPPRSFTRRSQTWCVTSEPPQVAAPASLASRAAPPSVRVRRRVPAATFRRRIRRGSSRPPARDDGAAARPLVDSAGQRQSRRHPSRGRGTSDDRRPPKTSLAKAAAPHASLVRRRRRRSQSRARRTDPRRRSAAAARQGARTHVHSTGGVAYLELRQRDDRHRVAAGVAYEKRPRRAAPPPRPRREDGLRPRTRARRPPPHDRPRRTSDKSRMVKMPQGFLTGMPALKFGSHSAATRRLKERRASRSS